MWYSKKKKPKKHNPKPADMLPSDWLMAMAVRQFIDF